MNIKVTNENPREMKANVRKQERTQDTMNRKESLEIANRINERENKK